MSRPSCPCWRPADGYQCSECGEVRPEVRQLTTADVAKALQISESTVRAYNARGQMPAPSGRLGRTPYWTPEDVEPWIRSRIAQTDDK